MTGHPRPWRRTSVETPGLGGFGLIDAGHCTIVGGRLAEETADAIVAAVNAHDDLVEGIGDILAAATAMTNDRNITVSTQLAHVESIARALLARLGASLPAQTWVVRDDAGRLHFTGCECPDRVGACRSMAAEGFSDKGHAERLAIALAMVGYDTTVEVLA